MHETPIPPLDELIVEGDSIDLDALLEVALVADLPAEPELPAAVSVGELPASEPAAPVVLLFEGDEYVFVL